MATTIEWSPNEGILRKLERLAFALVRTRPVSRSGTERRRLRNPWKEKCRGLGGPFALGIFIAIPYVTEGSSGSGLIAALLLAAIDACLAVWCYTDLESQHGHCTGDLYTCTFSSVGEFPAFLIAWWRIQGFSAAFAVCCRSLAEILDGVTGQHFQTFVDEHFGTFLPFGARLDILALLVAMVPTLMCAMGMEESGFLRNCLLLFSAATTLTFFGSSFASANQSPIFPGLPTPAPEFPEECLPDDSPEKTPYAKILSGGAILSVGFFGLYKTGCPDGPSVQYNHRQGHDRHFTLKKRLSLIGTLLLTLTFLFYFLEVTVLGKASRTSRICQDPPLLWSTEGGWRIGIASLGIAALSLATIEFLIPLCAGVTKMANDGLLYRLLRKDRHDFEESKWTLITPLVFGILSALQAAVIDTKVLLAFVSSSLMSTHVVIGGAMIASRYQVRISPSPYQKMNASRHRTRILSSGGGQGSNSSQARRLLTVSFLKSGLSKIPNELKKLELDGGAGGATSSRSDPTSDRSYLMNDVAIASLEPRDSLDSTVSGYESETDSEGRRSPGLTSDVDLPTCETDIDMAVADYQDRLRQSGTPLAPTAASGRHVAFATVFVAVGCVTLAVVVNRLPKMDLIGLMLAISSGLLVFLLLVVISRQPQRKGYMTQRYGSTGPLGSTVPNTGEQGIPTSTFQNFLQYSLVPCGPTVAIWCHSSLLVETLDFCGFLYAVWLGTGLIIYFSYGVSKSIAAPDLISVISPTHVCVPSERGRLTGTRLGHRGGLAHGGQPRLLPCSPSIDSVSFGQCGAIVISRS